MEPVVGHRRRKSSLIHPVGGHRARLSITIPHDSPDDQAERPFDAVKPDPASDSDSSADDSHPDEEMGLSTKDRSRRRRSRRRNRRLDNRIAREKDVSAAELREADHDVLRRLVINGIFGLLWFMFSLSISLYNKWMFDRDRLNFAFPLFTTSMHMLVQFALAGLVLYFVPSLRPQQSHNSDGGRSRHETEPNSSVMSKMFYLTRIGPCGAATGLDIGLGNASLKFISLTFYTMCKSSSLAFVLLFAFLFRLETPTWRLVAIIAIMIMGVILMVFGEVEFKLGGFVLVISAAFFSGFRWGLTQILLLRNPATSNPFSSIFFLSPVMFVTLLSLAIPVEGFGPLWAGLKALSDEWGTVMTPLFLLFPGCIAFLMTASEFALLQRTSVVTLSIVGIFKEVVTISAASIVFHDRLTLINIVGLITTMAAIVAYNYIKITKMRQDARVDVHGRHAEPGPLSPSSPVGSASEGLDADDEAEETAGLLHQTQQAEPAPALVTSDGDIQPNLLVPPHHAAPTEADDRRQGRVA
ncbi:nucleotide-sugar transporter [Ophiocordyceps camponoti-floridani]|uniref:Nucleotide-sugar transporter n=1 Tax=Ophiocordyceps camponoti-floridani TaxID=2030778 RepID=A0A8H4VAZ1_9HYPO|nr:nucleotide-sugar transporter [Ophiocordyceps camponoti-floridani]